MAGRTRRRAAALALGAALSLGAMAAAEQPRVEIPMTYLRQEAERPPVLSNLDPIPEDLGIAGAEVALKDTKSTGKFLGHDYGLDVVSI